MCFWHIQVTSVVYNHVYTLMIIFSGNLAVFYTWNFKHQKTATQHSKRVENHLNCICSTNRKHLFKFFFKYMLIFNYTFSKTWDITCYNHATYLFAITLLQVLMVKFYLLFVDSQMKFVHWPQFSEVFLSQCNVFHYRTLSVFMQCLLTQKIMDRISLWRFPLPTCLLMPPFNDMICRL